MEKCNKVKFACENAALFAMKKIKETSKKKVVPVRPYKCYCGLWHLTSRLDIKDIQKENKLLKAKIEQLEKIIFEISESINKYNKTK